MSVIRTQPTLHIYIIISILEYGTGWLSPFFCLSVCSCAIEITFPLSNFKTKHIFGILMALRKFFKTILGAPIFFSQTPKAADSAPSAPKAALRWRARETPPKAVVSRVYIYKPLTLYIHHSGRTASPAHTVVISELVVISN